MVERKVGVSWVAFIRADCFNDELGEAMKKAGCHQVLIGIESGDDEILKNIRKPIHRERIQQSIDIARKYGIESRCAFIFGNQGETMETMQRTLDYSLNLDPDSALYNISTPYPGTQLFQWAKDNGYLVSDEWSDFELSTFLLRLPTVSEEQVFSFYAYAHKKFYMRPKALWRRIKKFRHWSHIRDALHAFFYIVLRHKRVAAAKCARIGSATKTDFFDLDMSEAGVAPKLT